LNKGKLRDLVGTILDHESEDEIKDFVSDIRKGLSETGGEYRKSSTFLLLLLGTHYLSASGIDEHVRFIGTDFPDEPIFHAAILLISSIVFLRIMSLSYLRKFQRECYDWIMVKRYKKMGSTGLHELRLPSDPILGADLLRFDDNILEKRIGVILWIIISYAFFALPLSYITFFP